MTTKQLKELTDKWAADRGILDNGRYETQWLKLMSEFGELCDNVAKTEDVKDSIGDVLVVLSNMHGILNRRLIENIPTFIFDNLEIICEYKTYQLPKQSPTPGQLLHELGSALNQIYYHRNFEEWLEIVIVQLHLIAKYHDTTITKCWKHAYNEIKDRKGYLNELGNFIKES